MNEDQISSISDPLSAALTRMKLRAFVHVGLDAGKNWAVDFPAYEGFTLSVVQKGECWLALPGTAREVRLRAGDCFLLPGERCFTLADDLSTEERFRAEILFREGEHGVARCHGGGEFLVLGTIFRFQGHLAKLLLQRVPAVIHVNGASAEAAALRGSLDHFSAEMRTGGVGRSLILSHLAPIMLLQMLRIYLASSPTEVNWLSALTDARLSNALDALQNDYGRNWSLQQLADIANMSRSGFALTFRRKVGITPMMYLTNWRIQIACELLEAGNQNLASIASKVGYGSESAFSSAFTRIVKCRPGQYRKAR